MSTLQTILATFKSSLTTCPKANNIIHVKGSPCTSFCEQSFFNKTDLIYDPIVIDLIKQAESLSASATPSTSSKTQNKSPVASEEEAYTFLKLEQSSFLSYTDSNTPWFETLFPDVPVPTLIDSKLPKDLFNPLFQRIAQNLKAKIRVHSPIATLPRSLAARIEQVILASVQKSSSAKCPAKHVKAALAASHYPADLPAAKTKPRSVPKKQTVSPAPKASPASKQSQKQTPQPPAPSKIPTPPKASKPTKSSSTANPKPKASSNKPEPLRSEIIDCLKASSSPTFYFSADKTPAFESLFPKTTRPPTTLVSGNVRVAPELFNPLLKTRISSAHSVLRKGDLHVSKLPSEFMKYQTRLIARSIEKSYKDRSDKRQSSKKAKKSKQGKAKEIEFVPSSSKSKAAPSQAQQADLPPSEQEEDFKKLYRLKSLIQSLREQETNPDPRLLPSIAALHKVAFPFHVMINHPDTSDLKNIHSYTVVPTFQDNKLTQLQFSASAIRPGTTVTTSCPMFYLNDSSFRSIFSQSSAFYSSMFSA